MGKYLKYIYIKNAGPNVERLWVELSMKNVLYFRSLVSFVGELCSYLTCIKKSYMYLFCFQPELNLLHESISFHVNVFCIDVAT